MSDYTDGVKIIKATYELKIKAGTGGFAPEAIAAAEKRLTEAVTLFPVVAKKDLNEIEEILIQLEKGNFSQELLLRVYSAATELRLNSQMFSYPLVTAISESLCVFCENVTKASALISEVIALHLRTLKIAIEQGARAITDRDRVELLSGLEKANAKALKEKDGNAL
jgi:hypothetical protein